MKAEVILCFMVVFNNQILLGENTLNSLRLRNSFQLRSFDCDHRAIYVFVLCFSSVGFFYRVLPYFMKVEAEFGIPHRFQFSAEDNLQLEKLKVAVQVFAFSCPSYNVRNMPAVNYGRQIPCIIGIVFDSSAQLAQQ